MALNVLDCLCYFVTEEIASVQLEIAVWNCCYLYFENFKKIQETRLL